MKKEPIESVGGTGYGGYAPRQSGMEALEMDAGMDELLAALGYKVRSSDMAYVAQKLERLEMAMGDGEVQDDALLAHLASDTVHYNPSNLANWLEGVLSEVSVTPQPPPLPPPPPTMEPNFSAFHLPLAPMFGQSSSGIFDTAENLASTDSSTVTSINFSALPSRKQPRGYDSGNSNPVNDCAVDGSMKNGLRDRKRMRNSSFSSSSRGGDRQAANPLGSMMPNSVRDPEVSSATPVVIVDTQEVGIHLVHALMACAEMVQEENYRTAGILVKQISVLASSQGGAMRKVAEYFAEALARRIYRLHPQRDRSLDSAFSDVLHMHFYESCPYLKFAHFTANQAILEAFTGCRRLHVIDFSLNQGMQWPALMQALALRPGGPPSFRLTGIGPSHTDNTDTLQQVGYKLAQLAENIHVDFEFRGLVAGSLADLESYILESPPSANGESEEPEVVAINSIFELHRLLARPGDLEKVLATVRTVKPRIFTVVEQESNDNTGPFIERFTEALHYYSTMFDSLEGVNSEGQQDQVMSEVYLGQQICNVVACEGEERTERHETLAQWGGRMAGAGFELKHLGSNAFKQASMLLALFAGGDGYRVEEKEGCLTLGWHTRPLIATSAWRLAV